MLTGSPKYATISVPPAHRDDHVELSIESLESTATAEAKAPGGKPQSVGSRKFEPTKRKERR